jgi:cytochrome c-type biogenesis protein CcmH
MRRAALLVLALLTLLTGAPAAQAAEPKTTLHDVEVEVMCVTCRVPLNTAQSPQAEDQRDEIRRLIAQGLTKDEILDRLVEIYGPSVLATPKEEGMGLAAYIVPVVCVLAALGLLAAIVTRWRRRRVDQPAAVAAGGAPELSDEDARRLDDDLSRYSL